MACCSWRTSVVVTWPSKLLHFILITCCLPAGNGWMRYLAYTYCLLGFQEVKLALVQWRIWITSYHYIPLRFRDFYTEWPGGIYIQWPHQRLHLSWPKALPFAQGDEMAAANLPDIPWPPAATCWSLQRPNKKAAMSVNWPLYLLGWYMSATELQTGRNLILEQYFASLPIASHSIW